jgi:hypothetical protein
LYTTIGRVLRVSDASRFPLTTAILWALRLGDARVVYRAPDGRIFQLDLARDGRAGCIAVGRGMLQGRDCLRELTRFLSVRSGTMEIVQLTPQLVNIDLKSWPQSVIPGGVAEVRRLLTPTSPATPPAPSASQQATPQPQPAVPPRPQPPAVARPTPSRVAVKLPPGYQLVETFNPLAAAAIAVKGEKLSAHVAGRTCTDSIVDTLPAILGRAYIVCHSDNGSLHVIVEGKRVVAIYESKGDGQLFTGMEALEKAASEEAREARVYIDRG